MTGETIMGEDALPRIFRTRIFESGQIQLTADALLTDGVKQPFNLIRNGRRFTPAKTFSVNRTRPV